MAISRFGARLAGGFCALVAVVCMAAPNASAATMAVSGDAQFFIGNGLGPMMGGFLIDTYSFSAIALFNAVAIVGCIII